MLNSRSWQTWAAMTAILATGTLFQTTCNALAAETMTGLTTSILGQFFSSWVSQLLGVGNGLALSL